MVKIEICVGRQISELVRSVLRIDGVRFERTLKWNGNHWIGTGYEFNEFINSIQSAIDDTVKFCDFKPNRNGLIILRNGMRIGFRCGVILTFHDGIFFTNNHEMY